MDRAPFIERWVNAFNAKDLQAITSLYAGDVRFVHPMLPEPIIGSDAVAGFAGGMLAAFSDIELVPTSVVASGDALAMEVTHYARHTGTLHTPGGDIPPTDRKTELHTSHFMRFDADGRVAEEHQYSNPGEFMAQLGVA